MRPHSRDQVGTFPEWLLESSMAWIVDYGDGEYDPINLIPRQVYILDQSNATKVFARLVDGLRVYEVHPDVGCLCRGGHLDFFRTEKDARKHMIKRLKDGAYNAESAIVSAQKGLNEAVLKWEQWVKVLEERKGS